MASVPNSGPAAPPPPPVWDATPPGSSPVGYGGFWIRVVAYLLDVILVGVVLSFVMGIFGLRQVNPDDLSDIDPGVNLLTILVFWLYFALLESSERGATVGKMAMGLRVVTGDGKRLTFLNATGRFFARILSGAIFCIGYIMVAFTERKRGLHDIIANTVVIKTR